MVHTCLGQRKPFSLVFIFLVLSSDFTQSGVFCVARQAGHTGDSSWTWMLTHPLMYDDNAPFDCSRAKNSGMCPQTLFFDSAVVILIVLQTTSFGASCRRDDTALGMTVTPSWWKLWDIAVMRCLVNRTSLLTSLHHPTVI